jgi:transposase
MSWFAEQVCEVEAGGVRYVLRRNAVEAARAQYRLEDKLAQLGRKVERRNQQVQASKRCQPEAGQGQLQGWVARHKLTGQVELRVEGRALVLERQPAAIDQAMQLAGCYAVVTDVPHEQMDQQAVHDSYVSLQKVERDFRLMKTGLLEVRPVFVRKESRTRGHVLAGLLALKLSREMERRRQAACGTTDANPHTLTVHDAMAALSRLCLLEYQIDDKTNVTRLPRPDARQEEILVALGVNLPKK